MCNKATPNIFLDSHQNFVKNWDDWEVYSFYFSNCFNEQKSPEKTFITMNLNYQNE